MVSRGGGESSGDDGEGLPAESRAVADGGGADGGDHAGGGSSAAATGGDPGADGARGRVYADGCVSLCGDVVTGWGVSRSAVMRVVGCAGVVGGAGVDEQSKLDHSMCAAAAQ